MRKAEVSKVQTPLLMAPPVLLATPYAPFSLLARLLGPPRDYLGGSLFYWFVL
jgi:hypothetical protein